MGRGYCHDCARSLDACICDGHGTRSELIVKVAGLKTRVADLEGNTNGYESAARFRDKLAAAQPVLDAALAWYETQLHTPMSPKLRARTALILAIQAYKANP